LISLLSIVTLGFFLGMRHATDPDHVIAITTIVARHRKVSHAAVIGALWGLGHTLTILIVGGGIILLGWVIPARLGLSMEFSVGLMLIFLGILNLTGMLQWITDTFSSRAMDPGTVHSHPHTTGEGTQAPTPQDSQLPATQMQLQTSLGWFDRHFGRIGLYQSLRPLVVGLVHGLAGSAAVALLVLATLHNPKWAMIYLLVFGIGTIAGMMLITGAVVLPFAYAGNLSSRFNRGLRVASGLLSVAFGLFLIYEIGIVSGLFTNHPHWTPS
jgi:high-affinity nickel permease